MSKHVSRGERWVSRGPAEYAWSGVSVRPWRGAWWAFLSWSVLPEPDTTAEPPVGLPVPEHHERRLGPFKRPRNAMIAAEEEVTLLMRRHGDRVSFPE